MHTQTNSSSQTHESEKSERERGGGRERERKRERGNEKDSKYRALDDISITREGERERKRERGNEKDSKYRALDDISITREHKTSLLFSLKYLTKAKKNIVSEGNYMQLLIFKNTSKNNQQNTIKL